MDNRNAQIARVITWLIIIGLVLYCAGSIYKSLSDFSGGSPRQLFSFIIVCGVVVACILMIMGVSFGFLLFKFVMFALLLVTIALILLR